MSTWWFPPCAQVQAGAGPPGPHGTAAGGDRGIPAARGQEAPQTSTPNLVRRQMGGFKFTMLCLATYLKVTMYNSINVFAGNFATLYLRNYNRYQSETSCIPTFQHHMKEV